MSPRSRRSISRRSLVAAVAVGSTLGVTGSPARSHEAGPDPVYAAISAHRAARAALEAAARHLCDVEDGLVDDGGQDRGNGPDDDPLLIAAIAAFDAASDREARTAWVLARAKPLSLASAVALLRHAHAFSAAGCEWPDVAPGEREGGYEDWNCAFYRSMAAALAALS